MTQADLKYPLYIISKGRWESRLTAKALDKLNVPYHIVIEPQEFDQYSAVINPSKILVLPFSNLGQGSIPARNWVWEHSIGIGAEKHWILDDNIRDFWRLHQNKRIRVGNGVCFRVCEDLSDRYKNVALSGLQYVMFCPDRQKAEPILINTRVYSCILIRNDIPFRWRGRYNEDTDLSIRALKDGWCTILVQAFLAQKMPTLKMKGGNTEELYQDDGRLQMAKSLVAQHPDIARVTFKWGRYQHHVDYRQFKRNRLMLKDGLEIPKEPNNYGLALLRKGK